MDAAAVPPLIAESPGLDFLNTLWMPAKVEVEGLANGERLLSWMAAAKVVSPDVIDQIRATATPHELDVMAARARAMREWFRGFVTRHRGRPLTRRALSELEPLNRLLARDEKFPQLVARSGARTGQGRTPFELVARGRRQSAETLLLALAKALATLVAGQDFTAVKHCEGHACVLHFLDTTGRRRWCSMAVCGNRAKQAALRSRRATS